MQDRPFRIPKGKDVGHEKTVLSAIADGGQAALAAADPEEALAAIVRSYHHVLGDRTAHEKDGSLKPGERQYFVAGAFVLTPDARYHMLVGNAGFPAEQQRLLVPADAGDPGWVYANRQGLLVENTDNHGNFRQYLKTSRMGSAIYAPMLWKGTFLGQVIIAAQARNTMRASDLEALTAISRLAAAVWIAHEGPAWLRNGYPPENGFFVDREGVT